MARPTRFCPRNIEKTRSAWIAIPPDSGIRHRSGEAAASNLMGVSCEACHGPGGNHARYALTFVGQGRELTDDSLKVLRSKIERMSMEQCIHCHASKAHKPHPEFDREGTTTKGTQTGSRDVTAGEFLSGPQLAVSGRTATSPCASSLCAPLRSMRHLAGCRQGANVEQQAGRRPRRSAPGTSRAKSGDWCIPGWRSARPTRHRCRRPGRRPMPHSSHPWKNYG